MPMKTVWPTIVIIIHMMCCIEYARQHEYRRALYWFFAACITASVTY